MWRKIEWVGDRVETTQSHLTLGRRSPAPGGLVRSRLRWADACPEPRLGVDLRRRQRADLRAYRLRPRLSPASSGGSTASPASLELGTGVKRSTSRAEIALLRHLAQNMRRRCGVSAPRSRSPADRPTLAKTAGRWRKRRPHPHPPPPIRSRMRISSVREIPPGRRPVIVDEIHAVAQTGGVAPLR